MRKLFALLFCVCFNTLLFAQSPLTLSPQFPERGQVLTITYDPSAPGAQIPSSAPEVTLVFTYSNFYELPYKIPLEKKEGKWSTSFPIQRYAVYATFYLQSGNTIEKPSPTKHFEIPVHKDGKPIESMLLYKGYSLSAQLGKSDSLAAKQAAFFRDELALHPGNYEAKLRLIKYEQSLAPAAEKANFLARANQVIYDKWQEAPDKMGTINKATMGYLIMGENSRVDSIYGVVAQRYPHSGAAKDILSSAARKEKDAVKRLKMLEDALVDEKTHDPADYESIHEQLFDYYSENGQQAKALYHARKVAVDKSPYRAKTLGEIAARLTEKNFSADTAIAYAKASLALADIYPVGLIRYFPEYGYIPAYVDPSARQKAIAAAKSGMLSIIALNELRKTNTSEADRLVAEAERLSDDPGTFRNIALVHERRGRFNDAYRLYWKMMLADPTDAEALEAVRRSWKGFNASDIELNAQLKEVDALRKTKMTKDLGPKLLNLKAPELNAITDLEGKPVNLAALKGKVIVMDFWATWCVPCIEEFPYLQKVYEKFKDNPDVVFMVVNSGSKNTLADAKNWAANNRQFTFPIYYNADRQIGDKVGFELIPTLIVIDKAGKLQFKTVGFEGSIVELKVALEIEMMLAK